MDIVEKIRPSFVDERGEITNVIDARIQSVIMVTSKAGAIRGNHYHKQQVQYVYLMSGKFQFLTKDVASDGPIESVVIEAGDLVTTQPMVAHTMHFLEDSVFLAFGTTPREHEKYEEDTVRFTLR